MSELETEAKPLLTPMIQGTSGAPRSSRRASPLALRSRRARPARRHLDRRLRGDWSGWYSGEILGLGPRERPEGFAYCSTFLLGSLVFQVLGHDLNEAMAPLAAPEADRLSVQIWPDTRDLVRWPPDFALRDEGLHLFASQFAASTV